MEVPIPGRNKNARRDGSGFVILLAIVLFAIPSRDVIAGSGLAITPAVALALVLVALWIGGRLVPGPKHALARNPVALVLLIYILAIALSAAGAGGMYHPSDELRGLDRGLVTMLAVLGSAIVIADVLTIAGVKRVVTVMCWCATGLSIVGILQFKTGTNLADYLLHIPGLRPTSYQVFFISRSIFRRPSGTAEHPIEFGVVLAMTLPLAAYRAFGSRTRAEMQWRWLSATIILVGATMSLSRSAILGIAAAGIVLATTWSVRRIVNIGGAAMVVFAAMRVLIPGLVGTMISLFLHLTTDPSITGRTQDYSIVGGTIRDHPLVGRGFGTFIPGPNDLLDNQYLGTIVETGFIGLAALLAVFIAAFLSARGARRVCYGDRDTADLAQALAASIACAAVVYATFDALSFPMARGVSFLVIGCAGALWVQTHQRSESTIGSAVAIRESRELVSESAS
jgi:O-antigen ligase